MNTRFIYKKIVTLLLILSFITSTTFLTIPNRAHALVVADVIGGPSNVINVGFSAISAGFDKISSFATASLAFKEFIYDGLTTLLREILIQSITASIVNWINSGFEGEPAFITDLEGFMLDVADQVVGQYIEGSVLAGLCSPFKINVKIAIALDYYASTRDRVSCTLTGSIENVKNAFEDASSGGWDQWFEFSVNPYNNEYGSFLGSRQALRQSIASAQNEQQTIINWGNGFKSFEICDDPSTGTTASTGGNTAPNVSANVGNLKINCRIATPGIIINETLSEVMGSGFRQLELADEINEIIGALLGQLSKQVLGGGGGLSGLSRRSNGRPSYVDRLLTERRDSEGISIKIIEAIDDNLQNENKYRTPKVDSLNALKDAQGKSETLRQCYVEKASLNQTLSTTIGSGNKQETLTFTPEELKARAATASSTIQNTLIPPQERLVKEIEDVDILIEKLIVLKTDVKNIKSAEDLQNKVQEYLTLQESGQLKDIKDVFDSELERDGFIGDAHNLDKGIVRDMATLNKKTAADLEICQSLELFSGSSGGR